MTHQDDATLDDIAIEPQGSAQSDVLPHVASSVSASLAHQADSRENLLHSSSSSSSSDASEDSDDDDNDSDDPNDGEKYVPDRIGPSSLSLADAGDGEVEVEGTYSGNSGEGSAREPSSGCRGRRLMYPGEGMWQDIRRRAPWILRDIVDGIHPKSIASIAFMFFASIAPALTFGMMLNTRTEGAQGIMEVLFSTALCGMVYAAISGQPMIIMGVTGPICIFCISIFTLANQIGLPYLPWISVIGLWSAAMHFLLALVNLSVVVRFVTRFTLETFGVLIAIIYLVDAFKVLVGLYINDQIQVSLLSTLWALGTCALAYTLHGARQWRILPNIVCRTLADCAVPIAIGVFTGLVYIPWFYSADPYFLDVPSSFRPTPDRSWWVFLQYGDLPVWSYFAAIPPAMLLTALIFFDHNVSSMLAQVDEYGLKKGTSFHYDFFVVGILIAICSILGIPFTHGLIPQAPMHVRSMASVQIDTDPITGKKSERIVSVRENRLTGFFHAALIGVLAIWGQIILRVFPSSVLTGLFLFMGLTSLEEGQFWNRVKLLLVWGEKRNHFRHLRFVKHVHVVKQTVYTVVQIACAALIYAVTETPAGLIFPMLVLLLIPVRSLIMPRVFSKRDLYYLDNNKNNPDLLEPLTEEEKEKLKWRRMYLKLKHKMNDTKMVQKMKSKRSPTTAENDHISGEDEPVESRSTTPVVDESSSNDLELQEVKKEDDTA